MAAKVDEQWRQLVGIGRLSASSGRTTPIWNRVMSSKTFQFQQTWQQIRSSGLGEICLFLGLGLQNPIVVCNSEFSFDVSMVDVYTFIIVRAWMGWAEKGSGWSIQCAKKQRVYCLFEGLLIWGLSLFLSIPF